MSSEIEELWNKYYDNEESDSLYSTTGLDTSLDSIESTISQDAIASVVSALVSAMLVISVISLLYSIYMAIVKFMIAKKMGRGTGFAIASIFFWPIMGGVLAFSKNKATENKDGSVTKPAEPAEAGTPEAPTVPGAPVQPSRS